MVIIYDIIGNLCRKNRYRQKMDSERKIFFSRQRVVVSQDEICTGKDVIPIKEIDSADLYKVPRNRKPAILILILGVLLLLFSFWILGIVVIAAGGLFFYRAKDKYLLILNKGSKKMKVFDSPHKKYITMIVDAVNEAILFNKQ